MRLYNSSSDYLRVASPSVLQITGDLTIAVTVEPTALPGTDAADWITHQTAGGEASSTNTLHSVGIRNNGGTSYWSYFHEYGSGSNQRTDSDVSPVGIGTQQTVVMVRDISANTIRFIVDGVDEGTFSYTNDTTGGGSTDFYIGKSLTAGQEFQGYIGHVAVWDAALSVSDAQKYDDAITGGIDDLSQIVHDIDDTNLVAYYGSTGDDPEVDLVGSNNLTVNGTPAVESELTVDYTSPNLGVTAEQGYATDGTYHYVFDTTGIYKYNDDATWTTAASNTSPFTSLTGSPDHLNDGCVDDTYIYITAHNLSGGDDKQIVKYLKSDLSYDSHQTVADTVGVSGVGIDIDNSLLYLSSFADGEIRVYDTDFNYDSTITLSPSIDESQGVTFKNGWLYILSTNGLLSIVRPSDGQIVWTHNVGGSYTEYEGLDYTQTTLRYLAHESGTTYRVRYLTGVPFAAAATDITATLESITLTENTATTALDIDITSALESVLLSEQQAGVSLDRTISAVVESVSLTEYQGQVSLDRDITATQEAIQVTENAASVSTDITVSGSLESIQVTENAADIAVDVSLSGSQEQITITENQASLGLGINATTEQITLSEFIASVSSDRAIAGSLETIQVVENIANVAVGLNATTESILLTENQSTIALDTAVSASLETIVLNELSSQIRLGQNINSNLESITLTENSATLVLDTGISAVLESISLSTLSATITSSAQAPTVPGLEYTMSGEQLHYTLPVNRLHFTFKSED
jgi:hypothetical protein